MELYVQAALKSLVTRERNGACRVIEEWSKILNQSLQEFSPNLYSLQKNIRIEVNGNTKEHMKKLLKI